MSLLAEPLVIAGLGARTAIGATAPATAAAARAGIAGFGEHPYLLDTAGNRFIVAAAPDLSIDLTCGERLVALAVPAATEALQAVANRGGPLAVFVGLPPQRPGWNAEDAMLVKAALRDRLSRFALRKFEFIETGHAAGAMAVEAGWNLVRSGGVEMALVGGADSYIATETLEWLENREQVHSAGPDNNAYGFIPGEAAGFMLLMKRSLAMQLRLDPMLEVLNAATARETQLINTDAVCIGEGLTALFRSLSGPPPGIRFQQTYCDMNGEPYRADEYGFASARVGNLFSDATVFTAPADCWGDVGAASGPLFVLLADAATRKGYATGSPIGGWTSSESGERSGFVLRKLPPKGSPV